MKRPFGCRGRSLIAARLSVRRSTPLRRPNFSRWLAQIRMVRLVMDRGLSSVAWYVRVAHRLSQMTFLILLLALPQASDPEEDVNSNYILPPPDAPLLPLPPSAQKRPFEANSQQHGGQIALRTKQPRPRGKARPAPIVAPGPAGSASLPTPGIHATMDQLQQLPPSPHPLNPAPPGSLAPYPPSPSYAPQFYSKGDVAMRTSCGYTDGASLNEHHGPPPTYPPPPALGYTHQVSFPRCNQVTS